MVERLCVVAIVGRPNVGKSSLFNRLIGRRKAIVDAASGVTRDRLYAQVEWHGKRFQLVDTGGIEFSKSNRIALHVRRQVEKAIEEAHAVIFVCDAKDGLAPLDESIGDLLRRSNKPTFLVINKTDNEKIGASSGEFYRLGLGEPLGVSALHGKGTDDLLDRIADEMPETEFLPPGESVRVAIVGRPNVGKSSFLNCLLKEERVIVDDTPGTTRDAIDTHFSRDGRDYVLIDTAGIKHKRKIKDVVEMFGFTRTRDAIVRCDIALLLVDAVCGITSEDVRILGWVLDEGKGCIVVVNKWDRVKGVTMEDSERSLRGRAAFSGFIPVVFTSALTGRNVLRVIDMADAVAKNLDVKIRTAELNEFVSEIQLAKPAPMHAGKRFKLYYVTQTGTKPPTFTAFVSHPEIVHADYTRYIENRLRERFGLSGVPVRMVYRKKST
jgi:GTP-binding protein